VSIEYKAPIRLSQAEALALARSLASDTLQLLAAEDGCFSFRMSAHTPRESWKEDVELRAGRELYVIVHAATGDEREELVARVESILARMGYPCALAEE
jgi:hypothetical protein